MFERYTERARRVVFWARYIASQVGSSEIEADHVLLGLLREDMSLARRFLGSPWALEEVWRRSEQSRHIRQKPGGPADLPLGNASKRVLAFAAEEADKLFCKHIGTSHLLLGLLREEKCTAAEILHERGVRLASTREELARAPHDDSETEEFVRERAPLPEDVVKVQIRMKSIADQLTAAVANHDFAKAQAYSTEERMERDKLYLLCQRHGLSDWLYE